MTDYSRSFEHGRGIPGIFFKYDLEAISLTIRERTTSLYQFLVRLVGVIGTYSQVPSASSQADLIQAECGQSLRSDCECSTERRKRSRRPRRTTSSTSHRLCPAVVPPSLQVEMAGRGTLQEAIPEVAAGWDRGRIRAMAWASGSIDDPAYYHASGCIVHMSEQEREGFGCSVLTLLTGGCGRQVECHNREFAAVDWLARTRETNSTKSVTVVNSSPCSSSVHPTRQYHHSHGVARSRSSVQGQGIHRPEPNTLFRAPCRRIGSIFGTAEERFLLHRTALQGGQWWVSPRSQQ